MPSMADEGATDSSMEHSRCTGSRIMRHATLIAPVAPVDITDPELQALIARC